MVKEYIKKRVYQKLTGEERLTLTNDVPSVEYLHKELMDVSELGIYIHIPFCRFICPYCPYNKELINNEIVTKYTDAVLKEIVYYASIAGNRKVTSFYIGGGTPTTMLYKGIETIIGRVYALFNMNCSVHMESHPNDLSPANLCHLKSIGVKYLSIGVEALQDRHLLTLKRPYNVRMVKQVVERAANAGFECVNADYIFALPGQTCLEVEAAGKELVQLGISQAATYPLFRFPHTSLGKEVRTKEPGIALMIKRRRMLQILEDIFYDANFERSSVWAFTKKGVDKYCSVTVPLYLGLGASGGSYLNDIFYLNTFSVAEYIKALENNRMPVAISVNLNRKMQMAGWLYWRIYETRFRKSDFLKRFGVDFDSIYGGLIRLFSRLGMLRAEGDEIILNDKGDYWLHAFEDFFSIDFIGNLWGSSKNIPWPEKTVLIPGKI
jgi:oxygen-independent coproporphyrinogen-3 oxidase